MFIICNKTAISLTIRYLRQKSLRFGRNTKEQLLRENYWLPIRSILIVLITFRRDKKRLIISK